jgi:hypothetical protein
MAFVAVASRMAARRAGHETGTFRATTTQILEQRLRIQPSSTSSSFVGVRRQFASSSSNSNGGGGGGGISGPLQSIATFALAGGFAYGGYYAYEKYQNSSDGGGGGGGGGLLGSGVSPDLMTANGQHVKPHANAVVTDQVYFDVSINDQAAGRVVMGLFGDVVPKTVQNFKLLCAGTEINPNTNQKLAYEGSSFHRIIPGFMCQVRS